MRGKLPANIKRCGVWLLVTRTRMDKTTMHLKWLGFYLKKHKSWLETPEMIKTVDWKMAGVTALEGSGMCGQ